MCFYSDFIWIIIQIQIIIPVFWWITQVLLHFQRTISKGMFLGDINFSGLCLCLWNANMRYSDILEVILNWACFFQQKVCHAWAIRIQLVCHVKTTFKSIYFVAPSSLLSKKYTKCQFLHTFSIHITPVKLQTHF